jgi:hypothetical protein
LLEEIQNVALDYELQVQKQPVLPEFGRCKANAAVYREAAIEVRLRGDQHAARLAGHAAVPGKLFRPSSSSRLEIDSRAKEKTPQVLCNLVLARWFKPETGL